MIVVILKFVIVSRCCCSCLYEAVISRCYLLPCNGEPLHAVLFFQMLFWFFFIQEVSPYCILLYCGAFWLVMDGVFAGFDNGGLLITFSVVSGISGCRAILLLIRQYSRKIPRVLFWMLLPVLSFGRLDLITDMVCCLPFCSFYDMVNNISLGCDILVNLKHVNSLHVYSFHISGTGHGVGAALNVHEGPQSISFRFGNMTPLQKGMVVSNEPGYYEDHAFGIRIEVQCHSAL